VVYANPLMDAFKFGWKNVHTFVTQEAGWPSIGIWASCGRKNPGNNIWFVTSEGRLSFIPKGNEDGSGTFKYPDDLKMGLSSYITFIPLSKIHGDI
jgi:hypothetical protein